jgi:hypothetical protein
VNGARLSTLRGALAAALAAGALTASALAVLDPARRAGALAGLVLAVAGAVVTPPGRARHATWLACALACVWATVARVGPEFRGDAGSYFVYLRSAAFDHDLDFRNDWEGLELPVPAALPDGRPMNTQSVGPALAWSPFFAAAHAYVLWERAHGRTRHAADGFAAPYRRSPALGTPAYVLAGVVLLGLTLARRFGRGSAGLAIAGAVLASPVVYYTFVVPAMAHGLTFAACAALLWACLRAREQPSARAWALAGLVLGVAMLMRWQSAVWALVLVAVALDEWRRRRARIGWLATGAGLSVLALAPQVLAWRALYGRFFTVPQGPGYLDWRAPHLLDVLFSANHGLFAWSPIAWLGLEGLLLGLRRDPVLHAGALLTCVATAWVNGSVTDWDWAAGDAFGARRFDLAVPLLAWGLACLVRMTSPALTRRPWLVPAAVLAALGAWNLGLVALFRDGRYARAAPFDQVAADQARQARDLALEAAERVGGASGRALAYEHLSAEYLHDRHPDGAIELAAEERLLLSGWSARANRTDAPHFRWALAPESCVLVPLPRAKDLTVAVEARAPRRALPQTMTASWNGAVVGSGPLDADWSESAWPVARALVRDGENRLCLRFANAAPGDEGERVAAAVSVVRIRVD